jgi:hypothetical protein
MEHRQQSKNAYKKVSTESTVSNASAPLALSRPNEKYGATALSVETLSPPFPASSRKSKLSIEIIYLCVLIGDMTRGILFPTVKLNLDCFLCREVSTFPRKSALFQESQHFSLIISNSLVFRCGCLYCLWEVTKFRKVLRSLPSAAAESYSPLYSGGFRTHTVIEEFSSLVT